MNKYRLAIKAGTLYEKDWVLLRKLYIQISMKSLYNPHTKKRN